MKSCDIEVCQVHWLDLGVEMSPYIKYEEFPKFPPVGHLGPRFQNEAMYINGTTNRHCSCIGITS